MFAYCLLQIVSYVRSRFGEYLVTTVSLRKSDPIYDDVLDWILKQRPASSGGLRLMASTDRDRRPSYFPRKLDDDYYDDGGGGGGYEQGSGDTY